MAVIFIVFLLAVFLVLTTPLALTVAYFVLEDVHCNFLFAFFVAVTFAFNFRLFPALTVLVPVIFTFFTIPFMEVTFQDAETFILSFDAVIVTFFPPVFFFDGEHISSASSLNDINIDKVMQELDVTSDEAFVNIVTVDVAEYAKSHFTKSVRKNLTIPSWLNDAAIKQNINFSQVLQEALLSKIQSH